MIHIGPSLARGGVYSPPPMIHIGLLLVWLLLLVQAINLQELCLPSLAITVLDLKGISGIVSCDAAAIRIRIRIVRCQRPAKRQKHKHGETQPQSLPPLLLVGSQELVLKVSKQGQFHAAIRVTRKRCDSCAQVALGTRTVSRRNF